MQMIPSVPIINTQQVPNESKNWHWWVYESVSHQLAGNFFLILTMPKNISWFIAIIKYQRLHCNFIINM